MKRIFRSSLIANLPVSLRRPFNNPLEQTRSFKRMSRSHDSPRSNSKGSVDGIIQRYTRQKNMSETCRKWRSVPCYVQRCSDDFQFTLMSYNILAQDLLEMHENLYNRHEAVSLSWSHRYDRLMAEINLVRPDILCLQELQEDHRKQFSCGLANFNYEVIYKKRTGDKTDGCAIFYRQDLFELLEYQDVEYYQPDVKVA